RARTASPSRNSPVTGAPDSSGQQGARQGQDGPWCGPRTTAAIVGCEGLRLTAGERHLFAETDPLGFILFARNVESPGQVAALVAELREAVGRAAPVLIDQEGGRVQRLRPPHWRQAPTAAAFGALYRRDPEGALERLRLNSRL